MDKKTRTERYARCNTPAKRRKDLTVKFRYSDSYEDTYLFGPRDAAFFAAHQWADEDVRELLDQYSQYAPFEFDDSDAPFEDVPRNDDPYCIDCSFVDNEQFISSGPRKRIRTRKSRQSLPREMAKAISVTSPRPVVKPRVILPPHLRDPECAERRR
ncbi:hypothetical protein H7Y29_00870 [Microbacteriaceae bacterium]|nr:hypothetical protein [Candidatus Saccharibacteria bacterium]